MTRHFDQRMNQRGITRELIEFALANGNWEGDRCVLTRKGIQSFLQECDRLRSVALKALDKGGLVVVEADGHQITTYSLPGRRRSTH